MPTAHPLLDPSDTVCKEPRGGAVSGGVICRHRNQFDRVAFAVVAKAGFAALICGATEQVKMRQVISKRTAERGQMRLLSEDEQMRAVCGPEVMRRNDLEHASERKPLLRRIIHPFPGLDSQAREDAAAQAQRVNYGGSCITIITVSMNYEPASPTFCP